MPSATLLSIQLSTLKYWSHQPIRMITLPSVDKTSRLSVKFWLANKPIVAVAVSSVCIGNWHRSLQHHILYMSKFSNLQVHEYLDRVFRQMHNAIRCKQKFQFKLLYISRLHFIYVKHTCMKSASAHVHVHVRCLYLNGSSTYS